MKKLIPAILSVLLLTVKLFAQAPVITSFTPLSGIVGSTVTITGNNFNTTAVNNTVYFGATKAVVSAATATQLTVKVPVGATNQPISIANNTTGLQAYSRNAFVVSFAAGTALSAADFVSFRIPVTTALASPVLCDVDGDGKPDLVGLNTNNRRLIVYRNTATPGGFNITPPFAAPVNFITLENPVQLCTADIDGDGKPDIIVVEQVNNRVSIFRNTSTGTTISFASRVDLATGTIPACVAIGDIDNDGKPDIVVGNNATNTTSNTLSVFKNNATPGNVTTTTFASRVSIPVTGNPTSIKLLDADGDGKLDIALVGNNTIFRNRSTTGIINTTSFESAVVTPLADGSGQLVISDFNADGKPDMASNGSTTNIDANKATKGSITTTSFNYLNPLAVTNGNGFSMDIADMDGDGKPDLVLRNDAKVTIRLNGTTAGAVFTLKNFAGSVVIPLTSNYIVAGDIDGDGRPDILSTDSTGITILRNALPGLAPVITSFAPLSGIVGSTVTINGNGFDATAANNVVYFGAVKAVVSSASATQIKVTVPVGTTNKLISVLNKRNGLQVYSRNPFVAGFSGGLPPPANNFKLPVTAPLAAPILCDIDGDGKPDLIGLNVDARLLVVYRNIATSTGSTQPLAARLTFPIAGGATQVCTGDIDGDGKPDIILVEKINNRVSVLRNTSAAGAISFATNVDIPTATSPISVTVGDIDNDGKPDIVVGNSSTSNTISIFKNNSTSGNVTLTTFAARVTIPAPGPPTSVKLFDIDGDGKLDLAMVGSNTIFRNISTTGIINSTSFDSPVTTPLNDGSGQLEISDLNADGKPDMVSNGSTTNIDANRANGGNFNVESFNYLTPLQLTNSNGYSMDIADMDGDGKPDLILRSDTAVLIRFNGTTAGAAITLKNFSVSTKLPLASSYITVGDIDGDGRPDIVATNGTQVIIYYNAIPNPNPPVITALVPFKAAAGSTISITGSNFNPDASRNIVVFGNSFARVLSATATHLEVEVPTGSIHSPVDVINNDNYLKARSSQWFITTFASKNSITKGDFDPRADIPLNPSQNQYYPYLRDMDGDGKPDLYDGYYYQNTATSGSISSTSFNFGNPYTPVSTLNADLNNDGKPDMLTATRTGFTIRLNQTTADGAIAFGQPITKNITLPYSAQNNTPSSALCVPADIDGDGKTDLVYFYVTHTSNDNTDDHLAVLTYLNKSDGRHLDSADYVVSTPVLFDGLLAAFINDVRIVDLDGDGKPDLSFHAPFSDSDPLFYIIKNTSTPGKPSFSDPLGFDYGGPDGNQSDYTLADINGDGKLDFIDIQDGDGDLLIHLSASQGVSTRYRLPIHGPIKFADVDGDGMLDMLVSKDTSIYIYRNTDVPGNNTTQTFAPPVVLTSTRWRYSIDKYGTVYNDFPFDVGDIDGDGKVDIITGGIGYLSVFRNNPVAPQTMMAMAQLKAVPNPGDPVVHQGVSPNGDGVNDILTIDNIQNFPDNKVTILNSSGASIFEVTGYNNGTKSFNGYSTNGVLQKEGTYYYVLKYNDKGETKTKTGYIVLRY